MMKWDRSSLQYIFFQCVVERCCGIFGGTEGLMTGVLCTVGAEQMVLEDTTIDAIQERLSEGAGGVVPLKEEEAVSAPADGDLYSSDSHSSVDGDGNVEGDDDAAYEEGSYTSSDEEVNEVQVSA
mgnify:CR=1 FL=1